MKIATYNIMSGGFSNYDKSASAPERLPLLRSVINKIGADLIGLVDTYRWDELYTTNDLCSLFGYRYAECINLQDDRLRAIGHNNGLTLLSNIALHNVRVIDISDRDALVVEVMTNNGNLQVALTYLDDLSEAVRLRQAKALIENVNPYAPLIIMGDLNTFSLGDNTMASKALAHFRSANQALLPDFDPIIADMAQGTVIEYLEQEGLIDSDHDRRPTFPTKLFPANVEQQVLRLDYVMATPGVSITGLVVPNNKYFDSASDHSPIVFEAVIKTR